MIALVILSKIKVTYSFSLYLPETTNFSLKKIILSKVYIDEDVLKLSYQGLSACTSGIIHKLQGVGYHGGPSPHTGRQTVV